MINKVILIGNLGREPEVRNTQGGSTVATLNVATAERVKEDGNWVDHTEWHRCVAFGGTAENAQRFLKKGSKVFIEGRIRTNKWKDKDGQDRYTTEILVDNLRFLDSAEGGGRSSERDDDRGGRDNRSGGGQRETQRERQPEPSHGGFAGGDDDIPF